MNRTIRRPGIRPASWKRTGWTPAPNALTPEQIDAAIRTQPVTTQTVPDDLRTFRVGVFPRRRGGFEAYTRDYCADWAGCCVHGITASSGTEAKVLAVAEHKTKCLNKEATSGLV